MLFKNFFDPVAEPESPQMPQVNTALTQTAIYNMMNNIFQSIPVKRLTLHNNEECYFCDHCVLITENLRVVGRKRQGGGFSIRILKGLTYHTGNGAQGVVRDQVREYTQGKLYITNKRIIFSSDNKPFQRKLTDVISYRIEDGCLIIQFTNKGYKVYLPVPQCCEKAIEYVL